MSNQSDRILSYLRTGATLTPLKALRMFGTLRLGARAYDLRQRGHKINTRMVKVGSARVAEYRLSACRQ